MRPNHALKMGEEIPIDPSPGLSRLAYSIDEAAEVSGLSRAYIYAEWKEGRGPARLKAGKRTLITDESLRSWLRSLEYKSPPPAQA